MNKIQSYSHVFKIFSLLALIILPLALILYWINPLGWEGNIGLAISSLLFNTTFVPQVMNPQNWQVSTRILALLIDLIPIGFMMGIAYALMQLFKCYEKGLVFEVINAHYIKLVGILMLVKAIIVPTLYQALITLVLSWHNPPGQRYFYLTISMSDIVIAIIVIMISWIMKEAAQIKSEQDYTV